MENPFMTKKRKDVLVVIMQNTYFPRLSKVKTLRRQDKRVFFTFNWVLVGLKQVVLPTEK